MLVASDGVEVGSLCGFPRWYPRFLSKVGYYGTTA